MEKQGIFGNILHKNEQNESEKAVFQVQKRNLLAKNQF